jgi:hypothetical protein
VAGRWALRPSKDQADQQIASGRRRGTISACVNAAGETGGQEVCCLITILAFLGPRVGSLVWWLFDPVRWRDAFSGFNSVLLALAVSIFLPWTTIAFVLVAPHGTVSLGGWILIIVGLVVDLVSYTGGGYGNRQRVGLGRQA